MRRIRLTGQAGVTDAELGWAADDSWMRPALDGVAVLREPGDHGRRHGGAGGARRGARRPAWSPTACPTAARSPTPGCGCSRRWPTTPGAALGRAVLVDRLRGEVAEKQHLALHDPLTGLPNRRYFHGCSTPRWTAARADGTGVAVMLLDLDRFKEINDALGHETGDALLREVGERLRAHLAAAAWWPGSAATSSPCCCPPPAPPRRPWPPRPSSARVLERPIRMDPLTLTARASIGVAAAPQHGDDAQTLLRHADVAMYAAKEDRAGLRALRPRRRTGNSPQRLALIADLRDAVERRDLMVAFQPKVDPRTGAVVGAEALARWHHPRHGNVPPDEFIPLAEHSGLIRPLTLHVLEWRCAAGRPGPGRPRPARGGQPVAEQPARRRAAGPGGAAARPRPATRRTR